MKPAFGTFRFALGWVLAACLPLALAGCGNMAARGMNAEGVRLFQQSQYQAALQQFQQAIYTDPASADGYYNLAATYHHVGKTERRQADMDQAESLYNQCLDRDPNHRDAYRGLAVLLIEQKRTQEAFRLVQGWADRSPTSGEARVELARLWEEFGDKRAAKDALVEAISIDPNNTRAMVALGKLREELGERSQALANYQRALALDRFQPEVAARVASLQSATGLQLPPPTSPAANTSSIATRNTLPMR